MLTLMDSVKGISMTLWRCDAVEILIWKTILSKAHM